MKKKLKTLISKVTCEQPTTKTINNEDTNMTTKNIYAEVIDTYNGICKKVGEILVVSWNYWDKLRTKIENIYDTEVEDESECLTESASKFLENLYSDEDNDGTVLFEKLGFKDVNDGDNYLGEGWSGMQEDFVITITSHSKNYVKVKLYECDGTSTASLKIPMEYLQSDNYVELIKAKYEALDREIDRRTKKKSNEKSNKLEEITQPKIELKEKLKEFIGDKSFDSERAACEAVDIFAKKYSTNFKEYYVTCRCENRMVAVAYTEGSCFDSLKLFMLPVTIKG